MGEKDRKHKMAKDHHLMVPGTYKVMPISGFAYHLSVEHLRTFCLAEFVWTFCDDGPP